MTDIQIVGRHQHTAADSQAIKAVEDQGQPPAADSAEIRSFIRELAAILRRICAVPAASAAERAA